MAKGRNRLRFSSGFSVELKDKRGRLKEKRGLPSFKAKGVKEAQTRIEKRILKEEGGEENA